MISVDLNCDLGEGYGSDAALMDYVSSVNIACGFHAGDAATMRKTVEMALEKGVAIGAHPSFPDRDNFGRSRMTLPLSEVYDIVSRQINDLRQICETAGGELCHVKPHGALYNQSAVDADLARTIATAVYSLDKNLIVFGLSGSLSIIEARQCGLRTASEVFADRTYRFDGTLTPRSEPNALIHGAKAAAVQVLRMVKTCSVISTDGITVPTVADTICIHGDGENALEFARTIKRVLLENGVQINPVGIVQT